MTVATERGDVELVIGGMTCSSCAARIEKKLNRMDGVRASVNYATGKAHVHVEDGAAGVDDLVATVERTGYTAAPREVPTADGPTADGQAADGQAADGEEPGQRMLRTRLVLSALLTIPVVALVMLPGADTVREVAALILATPVVAWGARPFHRAALTNLRHGAATMDTLISMGTLAAYGWSVAALATGQAGYVEVAAVVTTFVLAGRYAEGRARRRAGAALRALMQLGARDVSVLRELPDGPREERIPVGALAVGMRFVVRPGEKVATDGVVESGVSGVDVSMLTGESVPLDVGPGDALAGATVNTGGRLVVRATRVGADTQLAQLARLVEAAQSGKAQVQRLADRVSAVFVPAVLVIALFTLAGWLLTGGSGSDAVRAAVSVLVIACPCALGLATPTALLVGTGRGAQLGILIRGPEVLESTRRVDVVVLDKTGTLTTGRMTLVDVVSSGASRSEVLLAAGALEDASEHPIARAVASAARELAAGALAAGALDWRGDSQRQPDWRDESPRQSGNGVLPVPERFENLAGMGVEGDVEGRHVVVGRLRLMTERGFVVPDEVVDGMKAAEAQGHTVVLVAWEGEVRGALSVADALKPTSAEAVARLRRLGLTPILLTGDHETVALAVGREMGIDADHVIAGVLPHEKVDAIRRLQTQGRVVAMVGDGVNDAAALAAADLGLAMGTGTDAAIEASDLTLVSGDLRVAADAIRLSRRTLSTIRANLFWAFAYNVAAIPLAAAGLLNPMIAGGAMAASSVLVVGNSLRLRRFTPVPG